MGSRAGAAAPDPPSRRLPHNRAALLLGAPLDSKPFMRFHYLVRKSAEISHSSETAG